MGSGDKFKEFSNNNSDIYNTDSKVGYPAKKKIPPATIIRWCWYNCTQCVNDNMLAL